jgi:O-6-methylguanine DNA methyltransferase
VTEAIYDAGYNSSGRFYEASDQLLGMSPRSYRAGGVDTEIRFAVGECSLGSILVAQSPKGICAILIGDDPEMLLRDLQDRFPRANLIGGDAGFEDLVAEVVGFVEAPGLGLHLPLDMRGTAFQQRVWQALLDIPAGSTASYTEVAERIGAPKAVRGVARACAANKIAVAIPCTGWCAATARSPATVGHRPQARPARQGEIGVTGGTDRVARIDWGRAAAELDAAGSAILPNLLSEAECRAIAALYPDEAQFRSRIVMSRHGFGKGEYKYFAYPLPDLIAALRSALYGRLAPIANSWNERMSLDGRYPETHAAFLDSCHQAGQLRPTPHPAAIWARRLQLPAPGSLRRPGVSPPGRNSAVFAGRRFYRRRVRLDRAAAAHAVAAGSRATDAGRRRRLRGPP